MGLAYRRAYKGSKYRTEKNSVILFNGKMYPVSKTHRHLIFSGCSCLIYPENKIVSITSSFFAYLTSELNIITFLAFRFNRSMAMEKLQHWVANTCYFLCLSYIFKQHSELKNTFHTHTQGSQVQTTDWKEGTRHCMQHNWATNVG